MPQDEIRCITLDQSEYKSVVTILWMAVQTLMHAWGLDNEWGFLHFVLCVSRCVPMQLLPNNPTIDV
jgi:hypothetical protein